MTLCIHEKGSRIVTEEEVRNIAIPQATRTFQPVRNGELIDMVRKVADIYGLKLENGTFGLSRFGQKMFGTYSIGEQNIEDIADLQLGIRNSCDKSLSAGICFGARVFVCDNLAFVGYADEDNGVVGQVTHKHTPNILQNDRLYDRLLSSFGKFQTFKNWQVRFYNGLKENEVDNKRACEIIVNAAREDIINKKDILDIANEWLWQEQGQNRPIEGKIWHPEFKSRTAFSLMNAFTEIEKDFQRRNFVDYPKRSMKLVKFLTQEFSLN